MSIKVAVVTGASYGLGRGVAEVLLQNEYKVYGISRTDPSINNLNFSWIKADLTKNSESDSVSTKITEVKVDLLVNCAGNVIVQKTDKYSDAAFNQTFDLNFKAPIRMAAQLLPKLSEGIILNISSDSDRSPDPGFGLYGSSKAALNIFFETMAEENPTIKIINLLPSYIDTPLLRKIYDNTDFDWSLCMSVSEVAQSISHILNESDRFETGSRILLLKKPWENGVYNPEKLWVYTTNNQSIVKASITEII
jgi:short-subunit dehydrogenase